MERGKKRLRKRWREETKDALHLPHWQHQTQLITILQDQKSEKKLTTSLNILPIENTKRQINIWPLKSLLR
jgi:hypothetical protein